LLDQYAGMGRLTRRTKCSSTLSTSNGPTTIPRPNDATDFYINGTYWKYDCRINSAKKTYLANLVGPRQLALVQGLVVEPSVEPADLVDLCKRLFDLKGNQKGLADIQDLLDDYDALSEYAAAHMESICKYGVIWKDPQVPERFTVFACFPEGEQINEMLPQAEDMNNAAHYEQKLNMSSDEI
jgi:hypothetical protein